MAEQFISEPISPEAGSFDATGMARGEPGLPRRFTWRGEACEVDEVIQMWKTSGGSPCGETYLRRHWWKLRTRAGQVMVLYCERQARSARAAKQRWFVYTLETG